MQDIFKQKQYTQLRIKYDVEHKGIWVYLAPSSTPTLTMTLLDEIRDLQNIIANTFISNKGEQPRFLIWASDIDHIFSLGIDLSQVLSFLKNKHYDQLKQYIEKFIDTLYINLINMNFPLITCVYVNGKASGASLDFVFTNDLVFTSRSSTFVYPAIKYKFFNSTDLCSILPFIDQRILDSDIMHGIPLNAEQLKKYNTTLHILEDKNHQQHIKQQLNIMQDDFNYYITLYKSKKQYYIPTVKDTFSRYGEFWLNCLKSLSYDDIGKLYRIAKVQRRLCR